MICIQLGERYTYYHPSLIHITVRLSTLVHVCTVMVGLGNTLKNHLVYAGTGGPTSFESWLSSLMLILHVSVVAGSFCGGLAT